MAHAFKGVIPILATPFNDDESLDLASWRKMIEFMVASKVDATNRGYPRGRSLELLTMASNSVWSMYWGV